MAAGCRSSLFACFALAVLVGASACNGNETQPIDEKADGGSTATPDAGDTSPDGGTTTPDGGTTTPDGGTTGDQCGFDGFKHALGHPCNVDRDCAEGSCYHEVDIFGDPGPGYCTKECGSDDDCPKDFTCDDASGTALCTAPISGTGLPGDHSEKLGEPCGASADCQNGAVCAQTTLVDNTVVTFCAPACDKTEADSCGKCGTCEDFDTGGDAPESFCVPKGSKKDGQDCETPFECSTFICAGFCTEVCGGTSGVTCPTGTACQAINSTTSICIDPAAKGATPVGGDCLFDFECAKDLKCRQDAVTGAATCAAPSALGDKCATTADCATGLACNDVSPDLQVCTKPCAGGCGTDATCAVAELDSIVRLYDSGTASATAIARNDDIDVTSGNQWSRITNQTLQPGTYWVSVETFETFLGSYTLSVKVAGQTPVAAIELPETPVRNDTAANAQEIQGFPFELTGVIDASSDIDYFKFTVPGTAPVTVTIEVGPGDASTCLPTALLGATALGQPCSYGGYCASGTCEYALKTCGQTCAVDADCGPGAACADLGSHKTCIDASKVGTKARNATCAFSYECADAYCLSFQGDKFCTARCEDPAVNCGVSNECATIPVTVAGQATTVKACLPEGDKTGTFNTSCVRQTDCSPEFTCTGGKCGKACQSDTDCPGQTPPSLPAGANACKACSSYTDCAADGDCMTGVGFEKFCVDACDASGKCPNGFHCEDQFFGSYCVPDTGTCRRPVCQGASAGTAGSCTVPVAAFGELCTAAAQCTTSVCSDTICSKACTEDSDCGCSDLSCKAGTCQRSSAFGTETEPNDTPATAQALTGGLPISQFGSFVVKGTTKDVDDYKIDLKAGDSVHVITRPVCGTAALTLDTAVTLYLNGAAVAEDDFFDDYGTLQYTATADGTYVIEVKDDSFGAAKDGYYVLEVTK